MTIGVDCGEISEIALDNNIFYPSELYYNANDKITDELIEKLMASELSYDGSNLLCCVAMAGGKKLKTHYMNLK